MPGVTVLEVPQWQGSGSRGAYRLRQGAAELAGLTLDLLVAAEYEPDDPRDHQLLTHLAAALVSIVNTEASSRTGTDDF